MYKAILVDDEQWVVESLKTSVVWEDYGFQIIGEVYSAEDALKMINEMTPHLVFTDIKMPGMSGLELLKKVKATNRYVQFVVVSGHAEFVYAQKALQNGAIGYCLKPFEESEIIDCLKKARLAIEASMKPLEPELIDLLFGQENLEEKQIKRILLASGVNVDQNGIAVIQIIGKDGLGFTSVIPHVSIKTGPIKKVLLINQTDFTKFVDVLYLSEGTEVCGIHQHVPKIIDLKKAIDAANISSYHFFITGKKGLYEIVPAAELALRACLKQIFRAIENKYLDLLDHHFQELQRLFQVEAYTIKHAFWVYSQLSTQMDIDNYEQLPIYFTHFSEMLSELSRQLKIQMTSATNITPIKTEHRTVLEMVQYVNENFYKEMNIQKLAQSFYVTPNYISHLFKKEMGVNFTEYVTKLRVNYAGRLLKESNHTIQQISEMSGFNDYFYFTRIFKKINGITPTEYRKNEKMK